jgi:hypothetical protein
MSENSKLVIQRMVAALNEHVIEGQEAFWKEGASWNGPAGAGVKENLKHFQEGWQRPFLKAFPGQARQRRSGDFRRELGRGNGLRIRHSPG